MVIVKKKKKSDSGKRKRNYRVTLTHKVTRWKSFFIEDEDVTDDSNHLGKVEIRWNLLILQLGYL